MHRHLASILKRAAAELLWEITALQEIMPQNSADAELLQAIMLLNLWEITALQEVMPQNLADAALLQAIIPQDLADAVLLQAIIPQDPADAALLQATMLKEDLIALHQNHTDRNQMHATNLCQWKIICKEHQPIVNQAA